MLAESLPADDQAAKLSQQLDAWREALTSAADVSMAVREEEHNGPYCERYREHWVEWVVEPFVFVELSEFGSPMEFIPLNLNARWRDTVDLRFALQQVHPPSDEHDIVAEYSVRLLD